MASTRASDVDLARQSQALRFVNMPIAAAKRIWERVGKPYDLVGIVADLPCDSFTGAVKNFALTGALIAHG